MKPIAAKPMPNIAHVDGSGTPEMSIVSFAAPPSAAPEAQLFSKSFLVFRVGPPPPKPTVNTAVSYQLKRVEGCGAVRQFAPSRVPRCR